MHQLQNVQGGPGSQEMANPINNKKALLSLLGWYNCINYRMLTTIAENECNK